MATIEYQINGYTLVNDTKVETIARVSMPYSAENMERARQQAVGEITVLDLTQEDVISAMSSACNAAIVGGVDVTLGDGTTSHYSLTTEDQINLMSLQSMVAAGAETVPYHADGEACRYYTAEEFNIIAQAATSWVLYHQSYFNSLKQYIRALKTPEALETVTYGMEIPAAYRTEVLSQIMSQMEGDA